MKKIYNVGGIVFTGDHMAIKVDGKSYIFHLKDVSRRLLHASAAKREIFEISPSGYGIHWPMVDEDISISGLLRTKRALSNAIAASLN